jgi:DNA-binding transcriptional LysR family regulator
MSVVKNGGPYSRDGQSVQEQNSRHVAASKSRHAADRAVYCGVLENIIVLHIDIRNSDAIIFCMQFEALKVFCDVVRQRSFSAAARINHVTQSAASQIVLQLERRLGVQLIDRSTRPLQTTPVGRTYFEGCRELVEKYAELEATIRDAKEELDAIVQVVAIYSVGLSDMGNLVSRFKAQHANANVQIEYLHPDEVYERVLAGTADFGLVSYPRRSRELLVLPWREEQMVLACSPRHRLAGRAHVEAGDLQGERYVGFDKNLMIRRGVDRFLREQGVSVEVTHAFDNIESIKKAIELDTGVALLPFATVHREVESATLVAIPLAGCRFVRPLGIIQSRQHVLSSTALRFRDLLGEFKTNDAVIPNGSSSGHSAKNGQLILPRSRTPAPGVSKRNS